MSLEKRLNSAIREIPGFPKPGINFKDITPVLEDPSLCEELIEDFSRAFRDEEIDVIVGIESRGFLFGFPIALKNKVPFVLIRKKGKLPYSTISHKYELEYGTSEIEMHVDSIKPGMRVLIHDDLLATGGTAMAAAELVKKQGGVVQGFSFLVELGYLNGRDQLKRYTDNIYSTITY